MHFEIGHIYHIFNQGNNHQRIFFKRENYLFFLKKIEMHILPYADVLAYCLMPNHFHLMVYVRQVKIGSDSSGSATQSRTPTATLNSTQSRTPITNLNKSIGILLASYTRAINIQENTTGSLFRDKTKTECLTDNFTITPSFYSTSYGALINIPNPEKEYPQVCFNYIHNNPVKAGLVNNPGDWEFSSFQDYYGSGEKKLINIARTKEYELL